jgi:putative membrane protein
MHVFLAERLFVAEGMHNNGRNGRSKNFKRDGGRGGRRPGGVLVASWTMNQFQKVWSAAEKEITGGKQGQGSENGSEDAEDATMKTADRISEALQGRHLTKDEKKKAGPVVHYAFGALMGAVYGASVEVNPAANALARIPFGAILFAAADEVALPALDLSDKPAAYPLSTHLYGLVSHAVYGVTTETVRRIVRG